MTESGCIFIDGLKLAGDYVAIRKISGTPFIPLTIIGEFDGAKIQVSRANSTQNGEMIGEALLRNADRTPIEYIEPVAHGYNALSTNTWLILTVINAGVNTNISIYTSDIIYRKTYIKTSATITVTDV